MVEIINSMTHVVVGIIIKQGTSPSYLLVSSKKNLGEFTGFYYPPGGHIEEGEDKLSALKREINEELGLKVISAKKLTDTESEINEIKDQKISWYLCEVDSYDLTIDKTELKDAGFFTKEEMSSMPIWPSTLRVFKKYILNLS
jgi:8-oxo-dGTP pyrophosphatase MutT (NUDIX family)